MDPAAEIKAQLFDRFKATGIENSLKAHLRIQLIQLLSPLGANKLDKDVTLIDSAVLSLLQEYLRVHKYNFTYSVFVAESGRSNAQELSKEDVLHICQIDDHSTLYSSLIKEMGEPNMDLLSSILKVLRYLHSIKIDKEIQVQLEEQQTLDQKLQVVLYLN